MNYNDLDARTIRERIDMIQLWDAWIIADDLRRHSFTGSIGWEERSGKQYLYNRKRGVVKSLGPRSEKTEKIHEAFHDGKAANKSRLQILAAEMEKQAAVLRALNAQRLPTMAARTLRAIRMHDKQAGIRVVGTNALYGYESLAGVTFNAESTATGDVDILVDDRNQLRLLTDDKERIGLARLIQQKVDKTFQTRGSMDYRLTNDKGYMIEFVRPEPSPIYRVMPGAKPIEGGDIEPAPIMGLQWLVNAPAIEVVVLDARAFPVPMKCPDPRYWAIHKLWLSTREDRDPQKKIRDRQQADIILKLISEKLPNFPIDDTFLSLLPSELREQIQSGRPDSRTEPGW